MLRALLRPRLAFTAALLTMSTAAAGCGDSTSPSGIAGSYTATTFRATGPGSAPLDVLALGTTISLTISSSNATSGTIYIPASLSDDNIAYTQSLSGTAVRTGNTVRFNQTSDNAVRDLTFTVNGTALQADQTINQTRVELVLTRQ